MHIVFDCVIEQCVIPYSNSKYNGWCQSLLTIGRSRSKELNKGQTQRVKYAARLKHVLHASPAPRDNTVHFTHSTYCLILKRCEFAIKCIKPHRIEKCTLPSIFVMFLHFIIAMIVMLCSTIINHVASQILNEFG